MTSRLMAVSAFAAAACLGAALPSVATARAPAKKPAATSTLAAKPTSRGSVSVGNPNAQKRLVEYISYTCGHCANFSAQSSLPLKTYVSSGKASVEYRSFLLNPFDFAAALLAHCGGTAKFPGNHQYLLATQKSWMGNIQKATPAQQNNWMQGTYTARLTTIATDIGLIELMKTRGITAVQAKVCLADEAKQTQLLDMTEEGQKLGINGTPSFLLNGALLPDVHDWTSVKAALDRPA